MTCHSATEKQRKYAKSLADRLFKEGHWKANRYAEKVEACDCIEEMSNLIDKMKDELEE